MGERNSDTPFLPQFSLLFTSIFPHFNLFLTSFLPQFNLCSPGILEPRFGNHGLQTLGQPPFSVILTLGIVWQRRFGPDISVSHSRRRPAHVIGLMVVCCVGLSWMLDAATCAVTGKAGNGSPKWWYGEASFFLREAQTCIKFLSAKFGFAPLPPPPQGPKIEKNNPASNFQSRLKFSILTFGITHPKKRGLVGDSLEIFNLA